MPRKKAPKGSGMQPRLRADGRWEARLTIPGVPNRKSIFGKTEEECAKKLRKAVSEIDEGAYQEPSRLTVSKWADIWKAEYWDGLKPNSKALYDTHIRLNIKPGVGHIKLQALTPHAIQGMYNKLLRGDSAGRKLAPSSIHSLSGVMHSMLKQAQKLGYIRTNPAEACTLPRVEKKEVKVLEDDTLKAFLNAIKGHEYRDVYFVDVFTGMRQGEILGLTWADVDFNKGVIHVRKQLQKERKKDGVYKLVSLKNDKPRFIKPAPFVMDVLKSVQREQRAQRLRAGSAWDNAMNLVFTNETGGNLSSKSVFNNFKTLVASIGMGTLCMHDLRHTFAMLSMQNGVDIKTLQQELGHHKAAFTLDTYGHVSDEMRRASSAAMQEYMERWKTGQ